MKPLHVLEYNGAIRPGRATYDEIRAVAERRSNDRLVHVTMSSDGEVSTAPVSDDELRDISAGILAEQKAELLALLEQTLGIARRCVRLSGINSNYLSISPDDAPYAEEIVRSWASERDLSIEDEAPPTKPGMWIRVMSVKLRAEWYADTIVRMQWRSVEIGEKSIAVEGMSVGIAAAFAEPF